MNISPVRFRGQFVFEQASPEVKSELTGRQQYQSGIKNPDFPQMSTLENTPNPGDVTVTVSGGIASRRTETHSVLLQLAERLGVGFRFIADKIKTRAEKQAALTQLQNLVTAKVNGVYQQQHADMLAAQQRQAGQLQIPFPSDPAPTLNAPFELGHGDAVYNITVETNQEHREVAKALQEILKEKSLPGLRSEEQQFGRTQLFLEDIPIHIYNNAPQPNMHG